MEKEKKIRLLIVDDSAIVREVLTEIFSKTDDIEVVGTAMDPLIARKKIKELKPDVLTLDIEMPRMDGITFLENLMRLRPMPVVMVSTLTEAGASATFKALELGAVDFVAKPKFDVEVGLSNYAEEISNKVRAAACARVEHFQSASDVNKEVLESAAVTRQHARQVIAVGSSTGGTEAIKVVLASLPSDSPPIVITQHIPKTFSSAFAERLNGLCGLKVVEAATGMKLKAGHVYLAPGDQHLLIQKKGGGLFCELSDGPEVNRHKPSVDVMFNSLMKSCLPKNVHAVILTGMGSDGAQGMLDLHEAGAKTMVQDEASSVVWGMPGMAVKLSATEHVVPLKGIAEHLINNY